MVWSFQDKYISLCKNYKTMASPIAQTPVMEGEDAKRFMMNLLKSLVSPFPESEIEKEKEKLKKMKASYEEIVKASGGVFY